MSTLDKLVAVEECETCEGDGISRCTNPDHRMIDSGILGIEQNRLGCPVCGHEPEYKIKGESCNDCNGTGSTIRPLTEAEREEVDEIMTDTIFYNETITVTLSTGIKVRRKG